MSFEPSENPPPFCLRSSTDGPDSLTGVKTLWLISLELGRELAAFEGGPEEAVVSSCTPISEELIISGVVASTGLGPMLSCSRVMVAEAFDEVYWADDVCDLCSTRALPRDLCWAIRNIQESLSAVAFMTQAKRKFGARRA